MLPLVGTKIGSCDSGKERFVCNWSFDLLEPFKIFCTIWTILATWPQTKLWISLWKTPKIEKKNYNYEFFFIKLKKAYFEWLTKTVRTRIQNCSYRLIWDHACKNWPKTIEHLSIHNHTLQFGGIRVGSQETLSAVPVNWSIESRKKNNGCIWDAYVSKCLKWAVRGTKSSGMFSKGSMKL